MTLRRPLVQSGGQLVELPTADTVAASIITQDASNRFVTDAEKTTWNGKLSSAVTTISFGTTGLTPSTATSDAITVAGTLAVANGGTGATTAAAALTSLGAAPSVNPTFTGGVKETRAVVAASAISLIAGNYFTKTATGALTWTITSIPAAGTAASFILDLTNGGTGVQTWMTGTKWASATAPTLTAAGRDILGFFTHDGGTTWSGLLLAKDIR